MQGAQKGRPARPRRAKRRRRTLRHVEPLSDVRTPHGKRRVMVRQGWAGEKDDFFSILLDRRGREGG